MKLLLVGEGGGVLELSLSPFLSISHTEYIFSFPNTVE